MRWLSGITSALNVEMPAAAAARREVADQDRSQAHALDGVGDLQRHLGLPGPLECVEAMADDLAGVAAQRDQAVPVAVVDPRRSAGRPTTCP